MGVAWASKGIPIPLFNFKTRKFSAPCEDMFYLLGQVEVRPTRTQIHVCINTYICDLCVHIHRGTYMHMYVVFAPT